MNGHMTLIRSSVLVGLLLVACGGDESGPPAEAPSIEFLSQADHGCLGARDSVYDCLGTAFLRTIERRGDTLALIIHFEANCCYGFEESVSLEGVDLSIAVVDTVYGCRCTCPFENEFLFRYEGTGELGIHFLSEAGQEGYCVSAFDTLVAVPQ